jgi:hypothetical protein
MADAADTAHQVQGKDRVLALGAGLVLQTAAQAAGRREHLLVRSVVGQPGWRIVVDEPRQHGVIGVKQQGEQL